MGQLNHYVTFRFSKKTGKVDTTMTSLGYAQSELWALSNTPKTKDVVIVEAETGRIVFTASGAANGMPKCKSVKRNGEIGHCEGFGIPLDMVRDIVKSDDRFTDDVDF